MLPNVLPNFLPNFLIVGAQKSATTSLYEYAREHPQVFMSPLKEPRFFVADRLAGLTRTGHRERLRRKLVLTPEDYAALFRGVTTETVVGEASPQYLYLHDTAVPNIRRVLGDPRIAVILRNPVDRAYSAYHHLQRSRAVDLGFEEMVARHRTFVDGRFPPLFHIVEGGFYHAQVVAFLRAFSRVQVLLLDDLERDPRGTIREFYRGLEVDDGFVPDLSVRHNPGTGKPPLAPETRARLRDLYRDDIRALQELLGRDLSAWLADPEVAG